MLTAVDRVVCLNPDKRFKYHSKDRIHGGGDGF